MQLYWLFFIFLTKKVFCGNKADNFIEELFIKTLPTGQLYSHFQFTTIWNTTFASENSKHYRLFPRPLGEVIEKFNVKELHLSLSQNRWQHELWGYPVSDASVGAELLVWFSSNVEDIEKQWLGLINVLSGMFCTSLNFMDSKVSINPQFNFRPKGVVTKMYEENFSSNVRYASLPNENFCTENLTPWKKLLPCGFKAGLSTMLSAIKLFDASYHSISVHFRHICMDEACSSIGLELSQTLGVVFDPIINLGTENPSWSFKRYFGRMVSSTCPLASSSLVYMDLAHIKDDVYITPHPTYFSNKDSDGTDYAVYHLTEVLGRQNVFNLEVKYSKGLENIPLGSTVVAHQFQTGTGHPFGGVVCLIYNKHPKQNIFTTYLGVFPHFVRVYLHTLKIESFQGSTVNVGEKGTTISPLKLHYQPGKDAGRPFHLELVLNIPANSVVRISFRYEDHLQKWIDYPPDANHGFYVAPAVITATLPSSQNLTTLHQHHSFLSNIFQQLDQPFFIRIYTEALLISLPTPDFSMPYNVICLVCTVIAVAFGSLHNITTKSFVPFNPKKHKSILLKVKDKVIDRVVNISNKLKKFRNKEKEN